MKEEDYKKELAAAGVDLPELQEPTEETPEVPEEPQSETPKEEPHEPLQEQPKAKRSIYDEYKDKKAELKSERELREQLEQERDELKAKLEAVSVAETPQQKQDAQDELEAFAKEINADPTALRKMRELFLKDLSPHSDPAIAEKLAKFEAWQSQNAQVLEKQLFEAEFQKTAPTLKELFPSASQEEMDAIKAELDRVSHTTAYHDKELEYVAFKHRDALAALVSPKKRGIEAKDRKDAPEEDFDFDPSADYASMSPKQKAQWEAHWQKIGKNDGLLEDAQGRKLII